MTSASALHYRWLAGLSQTPTAYSEPRLTRTRSTPLAFISTLPPADAPPAYADVSGRRSDVDSPAYEAEPVTNAAPVSASFPLEGAPLNLPSISSSAGSSTPLKTKPSFTLCGKELTTPLVTVKTVKAHLRLLACFAKLRRDVLAHRQPELEEAGITSEDRWGIFLVRAHHRFETWLSVRACEPEAYDLPTADFLLIWYTYLVHPRLYFEDNGREASSRGFDVEFAASLIDPETGDLNLPPLTAEARQREENVLGYNIDVIFDILPDPGINELDHILPVLCPMCRQEHWVPYLSLKQPTSGYAHRDFVLECRSCGLLITREKLSVARFALTLLLYMRQNIYINGTQLHPTTGQPDGFFAATLNNGMLSPFIRLCYDCTTFGQIGERLNWSMEVIERLLRNSPMGWPLPERVNKILSCYAQPQFSLDLVSATRRQCLFMDQLEQIGWLDPKNFETDDKPLALAVARYHQYLDLVAAESNLKSVMIPTLDINLVMQAHQTSATVYRQVCHSTMGMLPDNNQELSQKDLLDHYARTARLFKARFKQPYTTCGCERSAFSDKVTTVLKLSSKSATSLTDVLTVLAHDKSDEGAVATVRATVSSQVSVATHPCTHNMIYHAGIKKAKVSGKASKTVIEGHANTLLFPPAAWLPTLDPASSYGYITSNDTQTAPSSTEERLRPWITH